MSPELVRFALRKQRLQIRAAQQRNDLGAGLQRVDALLDAVDRAREGASWIREKVPVFAAAALIVAVAKPRFAFRVARRAWLGWVVYRRLGPRLAPLGQLIGRLRRVAAGA
ncbi:YqjK family protein [Aromatoleum sp.]|uniref:YqjK family protein n=1 Tax=Aromatoleum sp. TaxID=2307007 RepID=UPI002FCBF075